jgi:hypothetical protein
MIGKLFDLFAGKIDEVELTGAITEGDAPPAYPEPRGDHYVHHGLSADDYARDTIDMPHAVPLPIINIGRGK